MIWIDANVVAGRGTMWQRLQISKISNMALAISMSSARCQELRSQIYDDVGVVDASW